MEREERLSSAIVIHPEYKLRDGLPPLPVRIQRLPIDERGYPVPWFVSWVNGKPEFRAMDGRKLKRAVEESRCWVCGDLLGKFKTFVIGPMCAINRISSEPSSHFDCAEFSTKACPFLTKPQMVRRENDLPEGIKDPVGVGVRRNPGVTLLWTTYSFTIKRVDGGVLFEIGEPTRVLCYREGRLATKREIEESIVSGLPLLEDYAAIDGGNAMIELKSKTKDAYKLLGLT
jgi:hypothetical protein